MYDYTSLKKRLQEKTAKKLFCSVEELSKEQQILIDNQAWELAGIYAERELSEQRIAKKVAQNLQPETTARPKPAYTIIQATPNRKTVNLSVEEQFEYDTSRGKIYFSPLHPVKLFKAKLKYKLGASLTITEDKPLMLNSPLPIHKSECWLGIELAEGIENLEGFNLFFDWATEEKEQKKTLHLVSISHADKLVPTRVGLKKIAQNIPHDYREELWMQNMVEQPIEAYYQQYFLNFEKFEITSEILANGLPSELSTNESLPIEEENILWLHLKFPMEVTNNMLNSCSINCFPVLNRKLVHTEIQIDEEIVIIPLIDQKEEEDSLFISYFMGLDKVHSVSQNFQPTFTDYFYAAPIGTYQLIHGKGQNFDLMDAKTQVADFIRLLSEQRDIMMEVFKLEGRNDLDKTVKELGKKIHELDERLTTRTITRPYYFLKLKSANRAEPVFVYYWVTQGEGVNGVEELVYDNLKAIDNKIEKVKFVNTLSN